MANMCKDGNFDKRLKRAHPIKMMMKEAEHGARESVTAGPTNQITVRFWMRVYFYCYGKPVRMPKVAKNCDASCAVSCAVLRMSKTSVAAKRRQTGDISLLRAFHLEIIHMREDIIMIEIGPP